MGSRNKSTAQMAVVGKGIELIEATKAPMPIVKKTGFYIQFPEPLLNQ